MIEIWAPRYKDDVALIAPFKVKDGDNVIRFTKAKHLAGMEFHIDGDIIRQCPKDDNGKITCFAVPMDLLRRTTV